MSTLRVRAAVPCGQPAFIPQTRTSPGREFHLGFKYEDACVAHLRQYFSAPLIQGQWFEYRDANGRKAWCQTDILLGAGDRLLVIECKHSQTPAGDAKLRNLYYPVVAQWARPMPIVLVQMFKHRKYYPSGVAVLRPAELLNLPPGPTPHSYHWSLG